MRIMTFICAALVSLAASAQQWPQKPVHFIVPFPPGGATDISARLLGEKLSQIWGQQVIIENRGGAGGGVGAAEAARATPDGYTLFFPSGSVITANQHIYATAGRRERIFEPRLCATRYSALTVPILPRFARDDGQETRARGVAMSIEYADDSGRDKSFSYW